MTIDRRLFLSVAVCLSLLGAGCGGGSGNDSGGPAATRLRTLQSGDTWVYDVANYTSTSLNRSDRSSVSITKTMLNGQSALLQSTQLTSDSNPDDKSQVSLYYRQDEASGDLLLASDANGIAYPEPILVFPGGWKAGLSRSFTNGGDRYTLKVTGREGITVPAGTFDTWRMGRTKTGENYTITGTDWVAPETGFYVKSDSTTRSGQDSGAYRFTSVLRSTNTR